MANLLNLQLLGDNILMLFIFILAPISGYLVYEALKLKDHGTHMESENQHLKEDLQKMERSEKIKSEFMSIATHQLRTPLAKMKWSLQSLRQEVSKTLTPPQREALEVAYDSNEKMIRLVNDLMGMREIEETNLGYDFKSTAIDDLVEKTVLNFLSLAEKKRIALKFINKNKTLPKIVLDSWKISLALGNFIDNAICYTPEGGKIDVILENFGNDVKISIKDNGIGIPREEEGKIFTRFFRAHNAKEVKQEGTGLGLYIAKNIIKIHGGDVGLESTEKLGTTFYFTIPFDADLRAKENLKNLTNGT